MEELKPCPLCGGKMIISKSFCVTSEGKKIGYAGYCNACGMRTRTKFLEAEAIADRNRCLAMEAPPLTLKQVESIKSDLVEAIADSFLQGYQYGRAGEEYFEDGLHADAWDSINEIFNAYAHKPEAHNE